MTLLTTKGMCCSFVRVVTSTNITYRIYVELADQYKDIDPVSNVAKRNVLAEHLRDVIDILEQKVRHIRKLHCIITHQSRCA